MICFCLDPLHFDKNHCEWKVKANMIKKVANEMIMSTDYHRKEVNNCVGNCCFVSFTTSCSNTATKKGET